MARPRVEAYAWPGQLGVWSQAAAEGLAYATVPQGAASTGILVRR